MTIEKRQADSGRVMQILGIPTTDWHGCIGDDFDTIRWTAEPKCTKAQWETAKTEELAESDAQEYARNRAAEYPSTGDQLDMMYKDNKNSTTTHAAAVEAVKTKWPKDNSGPVEEEEAEEEEEEAEEEDEEEEEEEESE